jgi:hypothetical protein
MGATSQLRGREDMNTVRARPSMIAASLWLSTALAAIGCATRHPNVDPTREPFPRVTGTALDDREVVLPDAFAGKPVVLLVGYEMESQFDIDRWLLGLMMSGTGVTFVELPTIPGLVPGAFANQIDAGMRKGIPREDWGGVITVYGDEAAKIAKFTGDSRDRNARVLLLDAAGRVAWFHDRGYSPRVLLELDAKAKELIATA